MYESEVRTLVFAERANFDTDFLLTDDSGNSADNLERETSPTVDVATVVIGSVVGDSLQERVKKRACRSQQNQY